MASETPLTREQLHRMYIKQAKNMNEIARTVGCSTPLVSYYMKKYGLKSRVGMKRKYDPIPKKILERDYEKPMAVSDMAKKYNVPVHVLHKLIRKYGIQRRTGADAIRLRHARFYTKSYRAKVIRLYKDGIKMRDIRKQLGISNTILYNILQDSVCNRRGSGWRPPVICKHCGKRTK